MKCSEGPNENTTLYGKIEISIWDFFAIFTLFIFKCYRLSG